MKFRKTRGVSQGTSNYKTFQTNNESYSRINQTFALKNSNKKELQNNKKSHVHLNLIIDEQYSKNKIFDNMFPQPKIFNQPGYFPPKKSKIQQILLTLKNVCQKNQYQYFKVFNFFDEQKNGKISKDSVQKLVKCFGFEINVNQADLLVEYMNGNKTQKQIHTYQPKLPQQNQKNQNSSQNGFSLEDFIQKIGIYAEPDLKITGDPLLININSQVKKKAINRTSRRNQSINVKKLLLDPFVQKQPQRYRYRQNALKTDTNSNQKQKRRSPKARLSRFKQPQQIIQEVKLQKNVIKRIQSANPLIPRSSLPQQYFSRQAQNSITFKKSNNNFFQKINDKFIEDQLNQKLKTNSRYQSKLKKIVDNNEYILNRCKKQNELTFNRQKFTENWGMLSCSNGWVRS